MNDDVFPQPATRDLVERYPRIDLADWRHQGLLVPENTFLLQLPRLYGTDSPRYGAVSVRRDHVRLSYLLAPGVEASRVRFEFPLVYAPCHLGGERAYFECLRCRRRATVLYLRDDLWLCRACQNLRYKSQGQSALQRAIACAKRARVRAGGIPDLTVPFVPVRPNGMRWQRFERLCAEVDAAERRLADLLAKDMKTWRSRIAKYEAAFSRAKEQADHALGGDEMGTL